MIFGCDIETLARRELAKRLHAETVARFWIRSHVYSPFGSNPEGWREADSFLLQEHSPGQRRQRKTGSSAAWTSRGVWHCFCCCLPFFF